MDTLRIEKYRAIVQVGRSRAIIVTSSVSDADDENPRIAMMLLVNNRPVASMVIHEPYIDALMEQLYVATEKLTSSADSTDGERVNCH